MTKIEPNYPLIFAAFFMTIIIMFFSFLIVKYWGNISDAIMSQENNIIPEISKSLKAEDSNFSISPSEFDSNELIVSYNYKELFRIDSEKLLATCGENTTCTGENAIKLNMLAPYVINNMEEESNRAFILSFVNEPTRDEILASRKEIFEKNPISFGDSIIINLSGADAEPLILNYEIPAVEFDIINKTKTPKKYITLDIQSPTPNTEEEFSYEDERSFFRKSEFDTILREYLEKLDFEEIEKVDFFSHIDTLLLAYRGDKYEQKDFLFFINTTPIYPTISYSRKADEPSCLNWKEVASNNNTAVEKRYADCVASGDAGCRKGLLYMMDYGEYYLTKIPDYYPSLIPSEKILSISVNNEIGANNAVCRSELNKIQNRIISNILNS